MGAVFRPRRSTSRNASPVLSSQPDSAPSISTRFFVALAPMDGVENDFYGPPIAKDFFDSMMTAAEINRCSADGLPNQTDTSGMRCRQTGRISAPRILRFVSVGMPDSGRSRRRRRQPSQGSAQISSGEFDLTTSLNRSRYWERLSPLIEILEKAGFSPSLRVDAGEPATAPVARNLTVGAGARDTPTKG